MLLTQKTIICPVLYEFHMFEILVQSKLDSIFMFTLISSKQLGGIDICYTLYIHFWLLVNQRMDILKFQTYMELLHLPNIYCNIIALPVDFSHYIHTTQLRKKLEFFLSQKLDMRSKGYHKKISTHTFSFVK